MNSHILLYSDDSGEGGVAICNHSLLCYLAKSGYQVSYVQGIRSGSQIDQQKQLGVNHVDLGFTAGHDFARTVKDLETPERILTNTKPDLVIFSDGWSYSNFAAKQVAIDLKIPYLVVLHWIEPSCAEFSYGDGISYVDAVTYHYVNAQAVIVVSYENFNLLHRLFNLPDGKVRVIYNGISLTYFTPSTPSIRQTVRQELNIPDPAIVCFTSARLAPVKGHDYQLEAIRKLQQTDSWHNLYFLWAGTGSGNKYINAESKLQDAIRRLGVGDRVKLLGQRNNIADLLAASDIFILTSKAEGMPISIMEAMAKGLPVIASAVSGIPEELGDTGKLLPDPNLHPEGTIQELTITLQAWATDLALRHRIGQACKHRAEQLFREERMFDEYLVVIQQSLQPNNNKQVIYDRTWEKTTAEVLRKKITYGSLVWNAWRMCQSGNLEMMVQLLRKSQAITPFLPTETFLNWVESFSKFSLEQGNKFDTYSLVNLAEWRNLTNRNA